MSLDARTLAWISEELGGHATPIGDLPSMSAVVAAVRVGERELIVRQIRDLEWLDRDGEAIDREARILGALETTTLPTPRVAAVDPTGDVAGWPTLVTERLEGITRMDEFGDPDGFRKLAAPLPTIHAVDPTTGGLRYRTYTEPETMWIPPWVDDDALWRDAIDLARSAPPVGPSGFIHRDYHPGNVLTDGTTITGIVDWVAACDGPLAIDAARAALNLALEHDAWTAARFLTYCRDIGVATDPYWTIVDALDGLPYYDGEPGVAAWPSGDDARRARLEDHLRTTLQRGA